MTRVFNHPRCGKRWKKIKEEAGNDRVLMLMLYSDECSHTENTCRITLDSNLLHGFIQILNAPPHSLRNLNSVITAHLSYNKDYLINEEAKQWGKVVEELKSLCQEGLTLGPENEQWKVRLFCLCGDMKELNGRTG